MQKILIILLLFIAACSSSEPLFNNSVVRTYHDRNTGVAYASAVLIDCIKNKDNYSLVFLSCRHFLPPEEMLDLKNDLVFVQFLDGSDQPRLSKRINQIIYHPTLDITILITDNDSYLEPVKVSTRTPYAAEKVVAVGFPLGIGMLLTEGYTCYSLEGQNKSVCSAPIYPGSSGGGLFFSKTKELIGISIQILTIPEKNGSSLAENIHIYIPISCFIDWLEKAYEKG